MKPAYFGIMRLVVFTIMTWPVSVLLAAPAFAATQNGPFLVSDRIDSYAIAGEGFASHQNAVLGAGYGSTQSNGVVGITNATMSYGVQGISSGSSGPASFGVIGSAQNGNGIYGYSSNPSWAGIYATNRAPTGIALEAASDGTGVFSSSQNADGIVGQTHAGLTSGVPAYAGVHGLDVSVSGQGEGVLGESAVGIGVHGISHALANHGGIGVYGEGPIGVFSSGELYAWGDGNGAGWFDNRGVFDAPTPPSLYVTADQQPTSVGPTPLFQSRIFKSTGSTTNLMTLYQSGDLYISGKIVEGQGSVATMQTRKGNVVGLYASRSSEQTVEDVGEAQLISDRATVKLDAAFSSTLDVVRPYLVFLTSEGDCKQLYVRDRTLNSFEVHESDAGRGSAPFAYRIVGYANGSHGSKRLPDLGRTIEYASSRTQKGGNRPQARRNMAPLTPPREPQSAKVLPTLPVMHL